MTEGQRLQPVYGIALETRIHPRGTMLLPAPASVSVTVTGLCLCMLCMCDCDCGCDCVRSCLIGADMHRLAGYRNHAPVVVGTPVSQLAVPPPPLLCLVFYIPVHVSLLVLLPIHVQIL
jgi:hypothetical protein